MSLLNVLSEVGRAYLEEFQSLFSWMSLLNRNPSNVDLKYLTFQSLFSWMSLLNMTANKRSVKTVKVSILVLVDVALEQMYHHSLR